MAAFGVHFGSTNACLSICKDGKADVVANEAGDRVTPAIVAYTDHDVTVGLPAKQGLVRNASNTVVNVKKIIGRQGEDSEIDGMINTSAVKVVRKAGGVPMFELQHKEKTQYITCTDIATRIYKNMIRIAEAQVGSSAETHDAVITVPISFGETQRKAIRESATKAGFQVLRIIHEPSAALLAYDVGQASHMEHCYALVYRMGGTSLDVTVLSVASGMYQVVASMSTVEVTGSMFTDALVTHMAAEFTRKWKMDCLENKRSEAKLRANAENIKHVLSTMPSGSIAVDSLYEGVDFNCNVSRGRFEGLCGGLIASSINPVHEVLKQANLQLADISKVVVCGGASKVPALQDKLTACFPHAEILNSLSQDEIIAIGASKQAAILSGTCVEELQQFEKDVKVPCLSSPILIQTKNCGDPDYETVFEKMTPIPTRMQKSFTLAEDQTSFCLTLLTQTSDAAQHVTLAKVVMKDLEKGATVNAVFHVRGDGGMHVTCTDSSSKKAQDVLIEAS